MQVDIYVLQKQVYEDAFHAQAGQIGILLLRWKRNLGDADNEHSAEEPAMTRCALPDMRAPSMKEDVRLVCPSDAITLQSVTAWPSLQVALSLA